jgi:hypothetical protein
MPGPITTPCSDISAPTTINASRIAPPNPLAIFAPCPAASISRVASVCAINASSAPITSSPWERTPSRCRLRPPSADTPEKPSNYRISSTAHYAFIAETICYRPTHSRWKNSQTDALLHAVPGRNQKPGCPASITSTSAAAPRSSQLLNR